MSSSKRKMQSTFGTIELFRIPIPFFATDLKPVLFYFFEMPDIKQLSGFYTHSHALQG
jgi:hypothetical protein